MAAPNPPADPALNTIARGLLEKLYSAGCNNQHYVGTGISFTDYWLNNGGLGPEVESVYLSTGRYPSVLGISDEVLQSNIVGGAPDLQYYDNWGNELMQFGQGLGAAEWLASYDGIFEVAFGKSTPNGALWGVNLTNNQYVKSTTGKIVTTSGGSTLTTYTNPLTCTPTPSGSVTGTGPYTVTIPAGGQYDAITGATVSGTTVTITTSGGRTWMAGQSVFIGSGLGNGSGGSGWSNVSGTFTIATGGTGTFTVTVSGVSGASNNTGYVSPYTITAGQPIVNGMTVIWPGSTGTWTVSGVSVVPNQTAQTTTFTVSGGGGTPLTVNTPMTFTGQSAFVVNTSSNGFNGYTTAGVATNNWGNGLCVIGTSAATKTQCQFTYTGWFNNGTNYVVTGVTVTIPPWTPSTVTYTIQTSGNICPAQLATGSGGASVTPEALQWSSTAYSLTGLGTSTTWQTTNIHSTNRNLNLMLDQLASMCNVLGAISTPIILRAWAEMNGGGGWWSQDPAGMPALWQYTIAYLTGGAGPADSPGGYRGSAQSLSTGTAITVSGNQATVTTASTHTLVANDCVYFSGLAGTAAALNGAILPISPGSTIGSTTFVVTLTPALATALSGTITGWTGGSVYQNQPVIGCNGIMYGGTPTAPAVSVSSIPLTITYSAGTGSTATFITPQPHGLVVGNVVALSGFTGGSASLNGQQVVTATTTFTFSAASTVTSFTGTPQFQPQNVPVHNALYDYAVNASTGGLGTTYVLPPAPQVDIISCDSYGTGPTAITAILGALQLNSANANATSISTPSTIVSNGTTTVTVTMTAAHHLITGESVGFASLTGNLAVLNNGLFSVTVTGATTFTVTYSATIASQTLTTTGTVYPYANIPVGYTEYSPTAIGSAPGTCTVDSAGPFYVAPTVAGVNGTNLAVTSIASFNPTGGTGILMASDGYHLFTYSSTFTYYLPFLANVTFIGPLTSGIIAQYESIMPATDLSVLQSSGGTLPGNIFTVYDTYSWNEGTLTLTSAPTYSSPTWSLPLSSLPLSPVGLTVELNGGNGTMTGTWQVVSSAGSTAVIGVPSWATGTLTGIDATSTFIISGFKPTGTVAVPTTNGMMLVEYSAVEQSGLPAGSTVNFTISSSTIASPPALPNTLTLASVTAYGTTSVSVATISPHGLVTGTSVTFAGLTGGLAVLNGNSYTVTVTGSSSFTITSGSSIATQTLTGTGTVSSGTVPANSYVLPLGKIVQYSAANSGYIASFLTGGTAYINASSGGMTGGPNYACFLTVWPDEYQPLYENPAAFNTFYNSANALPLSSPDSGSGSLTFGGVASPADTGLGSLSLAGTGASSGGITPTGSVTLTPGAVSSGGESPSSSLTLTGLSTSSAEDSGTGAIALSGTGRATVDATGTSSLALAGTSTDAASVTASGSTSLSGSATVAAGGYVSPSSYLTLTGLAASGQIDTGTGGVTLTGSGAASGTVIETGVGGLVFSASAQASATATGSGSLALVCSATDSAWGTGAGALVLSGTAIATTTTEVSGYVLLSGTGTVVFASSGSGILSLVGSAVGSTPGVPSGRPGLTSPSEVAGVVNPWALSGLVSPASTGAAGT